MVTSPKKRPTAWAKTIDGDDENDETQVDQNDTKKQDAQMATHTKHTHKLNNQTDTHSYRRQDRHTTFTHRHKQTNT